MWYDGSILVIEASDIFWLNYFSFYFEEVRFLLVFGVVVCVVF